MLLHHLIDAARGTIAAHVLHPLAERLEKRDIASRIRFLARWEAEAPAVRRRRSFEAVVETVRFAAAEVPYYADLFARIGFDPERLARDENYLQDIPFLTKDIIRAEGDRLWRRGHAGRRHDCRTGGSTGPAAVIAYDQDGADWAAAVSLHRRQAIGCGLSRRTLHLASRFPETFPWRDRAREWLKCAAMNRDNAFFTDFSAADLDGIAAKIRSWRPHLVHGHPSTMHQVALHLEAAGIDATGAFRVFESSGELLQPQQRAAIARVFGCSVIDRYGLAELGIVAYQVNAGDPALMVQDAVCWAETLPVEDGGGDDDGADPQAEAGPEASELVLTATRNRMMPLIRYRTGDRARLRETPAGPALDHLTGRIHDTVVIGGRRYPTHYVQDVLGRIGGLREFQIEQRGKNALLKLVPEEGAPREAIAARLDQYFNAALQVAFVSPERLTLVGGRRKFRHLVDAPPVQDQADPALP